MGYHEYVLTGVFKPEKPRYPWATNKGQPILSADNSNTSMKYCLPVVDPIKCLITLSPPSKCDLNALPSRKPRGTDCMTSLQMRENTKTTWQVYKCLWVVCLCLCMCVKIRERGYKGYMPGCFSCLQLVPMCLFLCLCANPDTSLLYSMSKLTTNLIRLLKITSGIR